MSKNSTNNGNPSSRPFSGEIPELLEKHLEHLKASAISIEVIKGRKYKSVLGKTELQTLGFTKAQQRPLGILIPLWGIDGNGIVGYQFRPDNPRLNSKGKPTKYESPAGQANRLDCNPLCHHSIGNPSIPLWITEGIKKADSLVSHAECAVAITGIWNWRGKNKFGGLVALSDFEAVAWNGRQVYICPDSDYTTNPSVSQAVQRLAKFLADKKAMVYVVRLPVESSGKIGIDDFLAAGHTLEEVKALAISVEKELAEAKELFRSFFSLKGQLVLEVQRLDAGYAFAYLNEGKVKLVPEVVLEGGVVKPRPLPISEGRPMPIVGLPDENITTCSLLEPGHLYQRIKSHISKYVDLSDLDLQLCCFYILFSWFYLKVDTLGYLRFLADTGKGKSRALKVIGDLCFYPVFASGSSTFSGVARTNQRWRGTLVIDEADIGGDKEHSFIKYLNLGIEKGKYYILTDKQNPKFQEIFDPYSPKLIAMREPFRDNALEGRLLSIWSEPLGLDTLG